MPHRIFLVEDHPIMRRTCAQVLEPEADLVLCGSVASAEEALVALVEVSCDLLVTDVGLPGMDGIALVERVHALRPALPALVISAYDDEFTIRRAYQAGAWAYLRKQELGDAFVPMIRSILVDGSSRPRASIG